MRLLREVAPIPTTAPGTRCREERSSFGGTGAPQNLHAVCLHLGRGSPLRAVGEKRTERMRRKKKELSPESVRQEASLQLAPRPSRAP